MAYGIAAATAIAACDEIPENNRFIHMDEIEPQRAVLLVDFTGQYCINCPSAHEVIESLEHQYGDSLIAVSVHCGAFGRPYSASNLSLNRVWLMYDEGNRLDEEYHKGVVGYPAGVINMKLPDMLPDNWPAAVRTALLYKPGASVVMSSSVVDEKVTLTMSVSTPGSFSGKVSAWLVEDGITAPQMNASSTLMPEYVHNNVFRRSFTDVLGDPLTLKAGETVTLTYTVDIAETNKEHFDHSRLKAIGFIMDNSGVLEAARVKVSEN